MPKFGVGRLVFFFWGGGAVRLVCCLWCSFMYTNKMFFQSLFLLCVSSVCCRVLPGEFFPLLCSLAWLALAFFRSGLLCTAELRFSDPFFRSVFPHRGNVFLQSKKVRWSFALFLDFQFCAFFCFLPLSFGLVCSAPQSCGFRTGFFGPCSQILGMCSCKARRFVEALRSSWIFNFALFFASAFFLVWFAVQRTASVFTA